MFELIMFLRTKLWCDNVFESMHTMTWCCLKKAGCLLLTLHIYMAPTQENSNCNYNRVTITHKSLVPN